MTRRDTIIIATLVNAGLLACLFVTATRQEEASIPGMHDVYEIAEVDSGVKETGPLSIPDEVDLALKEFLPDPDMTMSADSGSDSEIGIEADLNPDLLPTRVPERVITQNATQTTTQTVTPPAPKVQPTVPEVPAKSEGVKVVEVKVKKGDMLAKIAKANGTTVKAIKEANGLVNDNLKVGQILKVPTDTVPAPAPKPVAMAETPVTSSDSPLYYTVQGGDNPWKIAKKFHVKFEDILKLNNMTEEKSRNLKVGQEIRVK